MYFTTPFPVRLRRRRSAGFTLVEIMIVVVIIGFLASMAIPSFLRVRRNVQNNTFVNDLRLARNAAEQYIMEVGTYPPDGAAGMPTELSPYMPSRINDGPTPVGGVWDWDYEQFGFKAGISVYKPTADVAQMQEVDRLVDDGDLSAGYFRARSQGYIYVIEF